MIGVMWSNAIILLPPIERVNDICSTLDGIDGYEDIIIHEGMYTFAQQSSDLKNYIAHWLSKLHFRVLRGILYVMRYCKELDWQPNASLKLGVE
jgi:hypothetical protein